MFDNVTFHHKDRPIKDGGENTYALFSGQCCWNFGGWLPTIKVICINSICFYEFELRILFCRDYCGGESYKGSQTMEGKTVVITGANTGIGRETALELAKRKAKVIMACRDMKKCEESRRDIVLQSENKHVVCRECDLASMKSIHEFAEKFKKGHIITSFFTLDHFLKLYHFHTFH